MKKLMLTLALLISGALLGAAGGRVPSWSMIEGINHSASASMDDTMARGGERAENTKLFLAINVLHQQLSTLFNKIEKVHAFFATNQGFLFNMDKLIANGDRVALEKELTELGHLLAGIMVPTPEGRPVPIETWIQLVKHGLIPN